MVENRQIELLKKLLREEVASFCRHSNSTWKKSIADTVEEIRNRHWDAVFFGGTLRSLLISRLKNNEPGRPRDIDIVMNGASVNELQQSFDPYISRQTRFGGLQLKRVNWQFDIWPLKETFAIKEKQIKQPSFADLPATTFFNVESIAVEVCPKPGSPRQIFSGDEQFFEGIINRTIEINREENPYPDLCVVRALVMAANLQWKIGPRLLAYLGNYGDRLSSLEFESIQEKHYGKILWRGSVFEKAMYEIYSAIQLKVNTAIELTLPGQLTFWPEDEVYQHKISFHTIRLSKKAPSSPKLNANNRSSI